jgi:hypothetical protein
MECENSVQSTLTNDSCEKLRKHVLNLVGVHDGTDVALKQQANTHFSMERKIRIINKV